MLQNIIIFEPGNMKIRKRLGIVIKQESISKSRDIKIRFTAWTLHVVSISEHICKVTNGRQKA